MSDPLGSPRVKVAVCLDQILILMGCNMDVYVCGLGRFMY